jgi:hypothetical protein
MTKLIPITEGKATPTAPAQIYVEWGGQRFGPFRSMEEVQERFEIVEEPAPTYQARGLQSNRVA